MMLNTLKKPYHLEAFTLPFKLQNMMKMEKSSLFFWPDASLLGSAFVQRGRSTRFADYYVFSSSLRRIRLTQYTSCNHQAKEFGKIDCVK